MLQLCLATIFDIRGQQVMRSVCIRANAMTHRRSLVRRFARRTEQDWSITASRVKHVERVFNPIEKTGTGEAEDQAGNELSPPILGSAHPASFLRVTESRSLRHIPLQLKHSSSCRRGARIPVSCWRWADERHVYHTLPGELNMLNRAQFPSWIRFGYQNFHWSQRTPYSLPRKKLSRNQIVVCATLPTRSCQRGRKRELSPTSRRLARRRKERNTRWTPY